MSFIRSAGCFLFSLLSIFMVLYVSAASRFMCIAILDLYFSEYLLISSLTVGIPRSLRISSFLTYRGPFTIVLRILACEGFSLLRILPLFCLYGSLLPSPIVVFRTSRLVLWSFYIFLIYFLCLVWIFGLLANAFVSLFSVFILLLI